MFKGKTCAVTGTLKTMKRSEAQAKLKAVGAIITKSVSSKTDYLIAGSAAGSKLDKARMRGVTVLNEDQFLAALEGKKVQDVEALATVPEPVEEVDLGAALVEFRQLAYGTPDAKVWKQICDLMDRCPDATLPMAVDYVDGLIDRWEGKHSMYDYGNRKGDDVRVAPYAWIEQIMLGKDSPRWQLIRSMNCHNTKLTGKVAQNMLEVPSLTNLQALHVGRNNLSGTFYKKLRTCPRMASLTHLSMAHNRFKSPHAKAWQGPSALKSLRYMSVHSGRFDEQEHFETFIKADAWADLEELDLGYCNLRQGAAALAGSAIKALKKLDISGNSTGSDAAATMLSAPGLRTLTSLNTYHNTLKGDGAAVLAQAPFLKTIEYLNISYSSIGADNAQKLIANLTNPAIHTLILSRARLGTNGAVALANATHMTHLTELGLYENGIKDVGMLAILGAKHLANLTSLQFGENPITVATLEGIVEATHLTKLNNIHLYNCARLSEDDLLVLTEAPHLKSLTSISLPRQDYSDAFKKKIQQAPHFSDTLKTNLKRSFQRGY